ncbi:MAG: hypothetical protein JWN46_518 [Acidimicrobiales bacterium]|nr:hypothetical protein [Acidimicrobiales bacterium]
MGAGDGVIVRRPRAHRSRLTVMVVVLSVVGAVLIDAGPAAATAPPPIRVDGVNLSFGSVMVGTTSPAQTVTITNAGSSTATGLFIVWPSNPAFQFVDSTCDTALAAGAACQAHFTYTPTGVLRQVASVTVGTAGGGARQVFMVGWPDAPAFPLRVTPTRLDFGPLPIGTTSATQTMVVTNASAANLSFVATTDGSGPFAMTTTCAGNPKFLQHGGSCSYTYSLKPSAAGDVRFEAALHLAIVGGPSATIPVSLAGHGGTSGQPPLRVTRTRLDFGTVPIGATSTSQSVQVTNVSAQPVTMSFAGGGPDGDFRAAFACPSTLDAGASCQIGEDAEPLAPGLRAASANFDIVVAGGDTIHVPVVLTAHGGGTGPRPEGSPTNLDLGNAAAGHSTAVGVVRVHNSGNAPMMGVTLTPTGPAVSQITTAASTCSSTLGVGGSCTFGFRYTPTDSARHFASYKVESSGQPLYLNVSGGPPVPVHEAFVFLAYFEFLNRGPTPGERSSTVSALDSGATTRRAVITSLASSQERVTTIVQALYADTLGRPGDPGGVSFWVGQIRSGAQTVAQVAAQMYASDEYFTHLGGGTNATWISDLYVKLLGRQPDPGGRNYWVQETVAHGRVNVAGRFFESLESRRTRVTRLYLFLLGRNPDTGGRDFWAGQILTHGDIVLAVELASSDEYVIRAASGQGLG